MKKTFNALKYTLLAVFIGTVAGCNEDFSTLDSNVLNEDNFNLNAANQDISIKAYNENLQTLQINSLGANLLGHYTDPSFGTTTASVITQVTPATFGPNFGNNPVIDSVKITIPYFSTRTNLTDGSGRPIFRIDSLFVKDNKPSINTNDFKLTIFQNTFFLRNFDPNNVESTTQNYYSNAESTVNSAITTSGTINFDDHIGYKIFEDLQFRPNASAREVNGTFLGPALEENLINSDEDRNFWSELLFVDAAENSVFNNANEFRNYFRGLYFKVEPQNNDGSMLLINFLDPQANITVFYSRDDEINAGGRLQASYTLNFNGNRVNTFVNNFNNDLPVVADTENGDSLLFLKGTEGAMGVVELFDGEVDCNGDGLIDALDCFKKTFRKTDASGNILPAVNNRFELKRLINEAILVIYEDENLDNPIDDNGETFHTHDRLFIYDLASNTPLVDYITDPSIVSTNALVSRSFSLGTRTTDDNGENAQYKLRLTGFLNNILVNESLDDRDVFKLGITNTNNVDIDVINDVLNINSCVTAVPATAIITPRGTKINGTNVDTDKKMRLRLFFTELAP